MVGFLMMMLVLFTQIQAAANKTIILFACKCDEKKEQDLDGCADFKPGLKCDIYYAYECNVASIREPFEQDNASGIECGIIKPKDAIEMVGTHTFAKISSTAKVVAYNSSTEGEGKNKIQVRKLTVEVCGISPGKNCTLKDLLDNDLILIPEDSNGYVWLFGEKDNGADMTLDETINATENKYVLTFTYRSKCMYALLTPIP